MSAEQRCARLILASCAVSAALTFCSTAGFAQTAGAGQASDAAGATEAIIVTGSRIGRQPGFTPQPVLVFDSDALEATGVNTLDDFARYLSFNAGVPTPESIAESAIGGATYFNLRGIGAENTLVLVNGRRVAPYGVAQDSGASFVDINAIPFRAIERIDVLKDGASAIYGSEATAGVVNLILKDELEGFALAAGYQTTTHGGAEELDVDASWGLSSERTNVSVIASFWKREALPALERSFRADMDLRAAAGHNFRSTLSAPMTLVRLPPQMPFRVAAEPACPTDPDNPIAYVDPLLTANPLIESFCTFNLKPYLDILPAADRFGLAGQLRHRLASGIEVFAELLGSDNRTRVELAPVMTDKTPLDLPYPFSLPLVPASHPGNPYAFPVLASYRIADGHPRSRSVDASNLRLVSGIEGAAAHWQWSVAASFGRNTVDAVDRNLVDAVRFQQALLGMGGAGADRYYDPFGTWPVNAPGIIDAFTVPSSRRTDSARESSLNAELSRTVGELPGGPLRLVIGTEYREQRGSADGDDFQLSGNALGHFLLRPYAARRDIWSVFAEASMPLLEDLEIQIAARYERYSDFGSTTNPKLGLRWQATPAFAVRGTYGESFRAPAFAELFEARRDELVFIRDVHRCAFTGSPADCFAVPVRQFSGGNDQLAPERGRSWFAGLSWAAERRRLTADLDVWGIEHEQRIIEIGGQTLLNEFPVDIPQVVRFPPSQLDPPGTPGIIDHIDATRRNVESLITRGVDLAVGYSFEPGNGALSLDLRTSYVTDYRIEDSIGVSYLDLDLAGTSTLFPIPRTRANASARWSRGAHGWSAVLLYTDGYRSRVNRIVDDRNTGIPVYVGSHLTLDLQYRYRLSRSPATLLFGCRNCADRDPPVYNYTPFGESLHDPRGAIVYLRWEQDF